VRCRVKDQTTNIVLFGEMGFMERGRRHIIFTLHLCMLYTFTNMNREQSLCTAHTMASF